MTIGVVVGSSDGMLLEINQIREELSLHPRISPKCKISFDFKYDNYNYHTIIGINYNLA